MPERFGPLPTATATVAAPTPTATLASTPTPTAAPTAPVIPTPAPFTVATTAALPLPTQPADPSAPTPTPIPLALPSAAGIAAVLQLPVPLPGTAAGTTIDERATNVAPADVPDILAHARLPQSSETGTTPLVYLALKMSSTVVLPAPPGFDIDVAPALVVPDADYYLAAYDPVAADQGWQRGYAGPAAIPAGTTTSALGATRLSFKPSGSSGSPFVFVGSLRYWFALYAQSRRRPPPSPRPTPTSTATPVPTATPTASPVPQFDVSPSTIAFTAPGQTQIVTATGPGRSGSFTASTSDASVATVSATSATTFIVTAGSTAGTATITLTAQSRKTATVAVGLTITHGFIH